MTTHTDYQIIRDSQGKPVYAVLPWDVFQRLSHPWLATGIPSAVVDLALDNSWSALRAWREYLGFTQAEVAARLGITQSAYSQHENSETLRASTRSKIATALGIHAEQLNF